MWGEKAACLFKKIAELPEGEPLVSSAFFLKGLKGRT